MRFAYKLVNTWETFPNWKNPVRHDGESTDCCGRMVDALDDGAVVLGDSNCGPTKPVLSVVARDWTEDGFEETFYPISFCPFCGEKVDYVEVN